MRYFNDMGACFPQEHYMVDLQPRLKEIHKMIEAGKYFTIHRGRQYGKTTTLYALETFLHDEYEVLSLDFQVLGAGSFQTEEQFVRSFSRRLLRAEVSGSFTFPEKIREELVGFTKKTVHPAQLEELFDVLTDWCSMSKRPVVCMIDEIDSAADNQVFLDFLAQLRARYLQRRRVPAFQSVILAGVHDVKNIKRKIRPDAEAKTNSPWNIAAEFDVKMEFSAHEIAGMLADYENDHHTGMDVHGMAGYLYEYTSGYPYLVSRLCKIIDEQIAGSGRYARKAAAWTREGFLEAVKIILNEPNTLFGSLIDKIERYPELDRILKAILLRGEEVSYNPDSSVIGLALMFCFVVRRQSRVEVANRIFETRIYNYYLLPEKSESLEELTQAAVEYKNKFIRNGHLDMELVLEKYCMHYNVINAGLKEKFKEEEGTRLFLLYLRPIINGTGNYYIEPQTRNARRMDVVVDYMGEQFIIELKVWRGSKYHEEGERQLIGYLNDRNQKLGYMLIYNFNQKKESGIKKVKIGDKVLIEAVV